MPFDPWIAQLIEKVELGIVTGGYLVPPEIAEELCRELNKGSTEPSTEFRIRGCGQMSGLRH